MRILGFHFHSINEPKITEVDKSPPHPITSETNVNEGDLNDVGVGSGPRLTKGATSGEVGNGEGAACGGPRVSEGANGRKSRVNERDAAGMARGSGSGHESCTDG